MLVNIKDYFEYRDGALYWAKKPASRANRIKIGDRAGNQRTTDEYRIVGLLGNHILEHRLIFLYHHGWMPSEVDHKNNNKKDNRIENLRPADKVKNSANKVKHIDNTTGFKGVSYSKKEGKFKSVICSNYKRTCLGTYGTARDAAIAYNEAAINAHGEFAKLNIIPELGLGEF